MVFYGNMFLGLAGNSKTEVVEALHLSAFSNPAELEYEMCTRVFANNTNFTLRRANRIFTDNQVIILKTFKDASRRWAKVVHVWHESKKLDDASNMLQPTIIFAKW